MDGAGTADAPAPAPVPLGAIQASLAGAALVIYLRDGPVLRALVVTGGTARLRALGEYATAEEAVLRLRADLDAQAGRALPAGWPPRSARPPGRTPPRSAPRCSARCWPTSATATWSWCRPAS